MNVFYPSLPVRQLLPMLTMTLVGCAVAGIYGVVHDQITYSISPEYFTRLKFDQFHYAEPPDGSPREFAGRIGFLATWWVGGLVAWVFARVGIMRERRVPPKREAAIAFLVVFGISAVTAVGGWIWGEWRKGTGYSDSWLDWMNYLGITETTEFMTVAYIHNASYLGGVIGAIVGCIYLTRMRKRRAPDLLA